MQEDVDGLERELKEAVDEIWTKTSGAVDGREDSQEGTQAPIADSWAIRMEEAERNRRINPIERVSKPDFGSNHEWKMKLLEMGR